MLHASFGEALMRLWPHGDSAVPGLRAAMLAAAPDLFRNHDIETPLLLAHLMAQISHECGAGRQLVENLNYSPDRLMQIWPSRFPTSASARRYGRAPRALANKVYNGRMGNAVGSDDGWTFRGRGAVQTTGRAGYRRLAEATGLDLLHQPDLVNDPRHFLACGVAEFVLHGCLPFARDDDLTGVTRRLSGGTIGLAARRQWLERWKDALGSELRVVASENSSLAPPRRASPAAGPSQDAKPSPSSTIARILAAIIALVRRN